MFGVGQRRIFGIDINTNKKTYYMYNTHGDVQGLINWAGDLTKNYEYDAFGNEINKAEGDTNPFRYCGEYYDTETGNVYLRNRYYNPSTGAFITEDPARDGGNWYSYCGGNPVKYSDMFGLEKDQIERIVNSFKKVTGAETTITRHKDEGYATIEVSKKGAYKYSVDIKYNGVVMSGPLKGKKKFENDGGRLVGERGDLYQALGMTTKTYETSVIMNIADIHITNAEAYVNNNKASIALKGTSIISSLVSKADKMFALISTAALKAWGILKNEPNINLDANQDEIYYIRSTCAVIPGTGSHKYSYIYTIEYQYSGYEDN